MAASTSDMETGEAAPAQLIGSSPQRGWSRRDSTLRSGGSCHSWPPSHARSFHFTSGCFPLRSKPKPLHLGDARAVATAVCFATRKGRSEQFGFITARQPNPCLFLFFFLKKKPGCCSARLAFKSEVRSGFPVPGSALPVGDAERCDLGEFRGGHRRLSAMAHVRCPSNTHPNSPPWPESCQSEAI